MKCRVLELGFGRGITQGVAWCLCFTKAGGSRRKSDDCPERSPHLTYRKHDKVALPCILLPIQDSRESLLLILDKKEKELEPASERRAAPIDRRRTQERHPHHHKTRALPPQLKHSERHARSTTTMAPNTARPRRQRRLSNVTNSSLSTSPERDADYYNDSFMLQPNDSQSSVAASLDLMDDVNFEERCRLSPVYRLPAELLIATFGRLASTKDLMSCMLVSKDWARNSVALLWHRPQTNNWASIHSVVKSIRKTERFFAYQDLVKRLNLSTLASQISDGTLMGLTACKRIERLTLTNCAKLTDLSLTDLIEGNRSLIALDVTQLDQLTDKTLELVARHCIRLQGLNITGCRRFTDQSLVQIAQSCRQLKRLKCNSCSQLTDVSMLSVAQNSSHLLEIDLYDLPLLESESITALLTQCRQLRELRLARCPLITDQAFLQLPSKAAPFDALRILDLTDCQELTDKAIDKIVQTCPKLRNLILAKCRQLTDRAVWAITKLGRNLHYIHLGHCARITDASIIALAKSCTRIRYIDLACCSNLTDQSITQLANLPKLKRVGLVKCAAITDRSIHALATYGGRVMQKPRDRQQNVSALERVHLSYCTLLTLDVCIVARPP
jgi:F-box and leucine-rich repeat protein GRR1